MMRIEILDFYSLNYFIRISWTSIVGFASLSSIFILLGVMAHLFCLWAMELTYLLVGYSRCHYGQSFLVMIEKKLIYLKYSALQLYWIV